MSEDGRYQALLDSSPEGILEVDQGGRILHMNHAGLRMVEASSEAEVLGLPLLELCAEEDRARLQGLFGAAFRRPSPRFEFTGCRPSRRLYSARLVPLPGDEEAPRVLGILEDISERRRSEHAVAESEGRFATLFDSAPWLVVVTSLESRRFVMVNREFERASGYSREELVGKQVDDFDFWVDTDLRALVLRGAELGEQEHGLRASFRDRAGRVHHAQLSVRPVTMAGERCAIFQALDITAQRENELQREKFEAQLRQTQKLESLGVMAGGIAHDFNNLLTGMLGNVELALRDPALSERARAALERAQLAAERATDLTRQLLAYSGADPADRRSLDFDEVAREMARLSQTALRGGAELTLELHSEAQVRADRGQLAQLIMNLVTNAAEALGSEGGSVTLRTRRHAPTQESFAEWYFHEGVGEGEHVLLEVTDTGCGMEPETLRRLFEPFYTTKFTGRGLGLAAVLGIVRAHQGALDIRSKVGEGTTFRVSLPVAPHGQQTSERPPSPAHDAGSVRRASLLIVDDEEVVRTSLEAMLEVMGHTSKQATDGIQALSMLADADALPDAVLLDVTMPKLSGLEVLARVRAQHPELPVLLMSGHSEGAADVKDRYTRFLAKPFTTATLREAVQRLLARPGASAEVSRAAGSALGSR